MSVVQFVAEVTVYDPNTGNTRTLYFATKGFSSTPSDTPDHTHFDGVLRQPATITRTLFAPRATRGRSTVNYGSLILENGNANQDRFAFYRLDGRSVTIRRGIVGGAYPADFATDLVGTIGGPADVTQEIVEIKLRDRQSEVDKPLQPTKYSGAGLGTLEGVAGDLKGKPKPFLIGAVENISPPCVETSKLIYQIHDGSGVTLQAVRDRGLALTDAGGSYASTTALLDNANAPPSGQYKIYSGSEGTYFRLGSQPDGQVTCDATQGAAASDRTVAQQYVRLLQRAGFVAGDWSASDITAHDTANNDVVGGWFSEEITYADVFDLLVNSTGSAWFVDIAGDFRLKQLTNPSGTPVLTFKKPDLVKPLLRVATSNHGEGKPTHKTVVRYRKNWTVQTSDLAGAVTQANREFFGKEWREAVAEDSTVQTASPLAVQDEVDTLLTVEADASAEATRLQALYGAPRDVYELVVKLNDDTAALELNDVIEVIHDRYHLSAVGSDELGGLMRVIGLEPDARKQELTITGWGPTVTQANRITQDGILTYRVTQDGSYRVTAAA